MTRCSVVHAALVAGGPRTADVVRHLEGCAACRSLAARGGALAHALAEGGEPDAPATPPDAASFARLAAGIAAEEGSRTPLRAQLRAASVATRMGLLAGLLLLLSVVVLIVAPRADLAVYPWPRMVLTVGAYLGLGAWLAGAALRPLHRSPSPLEPVALAAALIVVPLALAWLPAAHLVHAASRMGSGAMLWPKAVPCLAFGVAAGLPLAACLWLLERNGQGGRHRALVAAAAAGIGGSLVLHLECAVTLPAHLLAGHAAVPLVGVLLWTAGLAHVRARAARA